MALSEAQEEAFAKMLEEDKDQDGVFVLDNYHIGTAKALARKGLLEVVPNPSGTRWKGRIINWWLHGDEKPADVRPNTPAEVAMAVEEPSDIDKAREECRGITRFRLVGDQDLIAKGKWRRYKGVCTEEVRAKLRKKFGDKLAMIQNELVGMYE